MNPAELKTIRENLGLSLQWLAQQAGVRLRSVEHWEAGKSPVPEDVAGLLTSLDEQLWQLVADYLAQVNEIKAEEGRMPEGIVLIRYKTDEDLWEFHSGFKPIPASSHAMLLARTRRELSKIGVACIIEYMDPKAYRKWLNGRQDDETLRSKWAVAGHRK